ncbi:MAG: hypothetical protein ACOC5J_01780 [Gemmatimonadota bacterium]
MFRSTRISRYAVKVAGAALAATLLWTGSAEAQTPIPFSVEARTGATFPTGDLGDGTDTGFLLAADLYMGLFPRFDLYGGYAWHKFSVDGPDDDVTEQGPRLGVRVNFPVPVAIAPWVRGGLSWSSTDGLAGDPDSELGLEFAGGLDWSVLPTLSLSPGLHYKTVTQDLGGGTGEVDVSYLTLELGARLSL